MSRITHDNIDKWLFNLHEGNLTSSEKKALDQFLAAHPEYQEDAEAWKSSHVNENLAPYAFEAELHAIATESTFFNYRKWAVAAGLLFLLGGSTWFLFFGSEGDNTNKLAENNSLNKSDENTSTFPFLTGKNKSGINSEKNNSGINPSNSNSSGNISESNDGSVNKNNLASNKNNSATYSFENLNDYLPHYLKKRKKVKIDIKNDVNIKTEKSYEIVNENSASNPSTDGNNQPAEEQTAEADSRVKLALKENIYVQRISENKGRKTENNRRKNDRYRLAPDPVFTNLRNPHLLLTNNHLIDQYAGFSGGMISSRFTANYRNNWTGTEGLNSQSTMISYDKLMRKIKTGIGITAFYNDYNSGMFTTAGAAISISPKFKLGRGTSLEPSVTFSYAQKNADATRTIPGTMIEDNRGNVLELNRNGIIPSVSTANTPDLKIGAVFQNKKLWAATSINHLLTPEEPLYSTEENLYNKGIEFKATVGTDYMHRPESGNVFSPQMSIYYHDGYTEMWLGSMARFKQFSIGGSFSQLKDFLATAGFQTHSFKVFYQFDQTWSMLQNKKIASHEVGMSFALNGSNRNSKSILNNER